MSGADDALALANALTRRAVQLAGGLEDGSADLYELVTPTTAELLRWWFLEDLCAPRAFNFHAGQRQAILNTIVAHEVLAAADLKSLYQAVAPDALLSGNRLHEVSQPRHAHPKYCLKMATGTGKTWVLQALMVWQLLNRNAVQDEGIDDPRFTRHFLIVAPGLIVYDRLLDAFLGKMREGARDFSTSDMVRYAELFVPESRREAVFGFVRGNVCTKDEIGLKTTGNGMIAITNWHLLAEADEVFADEDIEAPGADAAAHDVIASLLPLTPGKATGNSLEVLDRRHARGGVLDHLSALPELVVFNDEAHHIHEVRREGESTEVEWQKSLNRIAGRKGRHFVQVDFSATPYNDVGSGRNRRKAYFPHVVVDFDLKAAMAAGLVKSLVLDRRKEIGALPLEFRAERDEEGNPKLSEGQLVMLRAGLAKLRKLEADFSRLDPERPPKMLVVCEDTTVSPLVVRFLKDEGLADDEVMAIDSGRKAELGEKDWAPIRERLFDLDRHATPRVIVSVLMLREGFDVNNICVIVPLRSSQAQILLEQTIGRGLRLMWRETDYAEIKRDNRDRIRNGQEPASLIDVLSIVEHPAFQSFYDELMAAGVAGMTSEDSELSSSTGDVISVGLRDGFEAFDFAIPFVLRETDEWVERQAPEIEELPPFSAMSRNELMAMLGKGDVFVSQDLQTSTLFGDYRVDGAVMNVAGYNDFLARLTRRIAQALSHPLPRGNRIAAHLQTPYLQVNTAELTGWLEHYVRNRLFGGAFDPMVDENWRLLLLQPVIDHITRVFAVALIESETTQVGGESEVRFRCLSEVTRLPMRESASLPVTKSIYERQAYPIRSGGLEKAFIEWAQADSSIEAFCKLSETRHDFVRLRYVKDDGLPAFYSPDFLVREPDAVYLVETKAQGQLSTPNVQRKLKAATAWCERINTLDPNLRNGRQWHYVLLGEDAFHDWRKKGAHLAELLRYARVRPMNDAARQQTLELGR